MQKDTLSGQHAILPLAPVAAKVSNAPILPDAVMRANVHCQPTAENVTTSNIWQGMAVTQIVRYLSHPQVLIDPAKPVPTWSLSEVGAKRVAVLAASSALSGTKHLISSSETKAIETATPLAEALDCRLMVREAMHENDRSATGFLPPDEFESVADQFFAHPHKSVRGWETAKAAQGRIVKEVHDCLKTCSFGDVLIVGHGGVGTLLFCHLSDAQISRKFDQGAGGGGCYFEFTAPYSKSLAGRLETDREPD